MFKKKSQGQLPPSKPPSPYLNQSSGTFSPWGHWHPNGKRHSANFLRNDMIDKRQH